MMNNIKIVIAAAVVASVCSCGKEQIDNTPSPVVLDDSFTLDATLESTSPDNGLKTTIDKIGANNYAVWSASDKIDVYGTDGNKITMSIAEKDGTYARFKIESTNGQEGEFTPLYAVYPAGIGTLSSKTLTFSTSDTQIYRDGSFADGCNVAVGTVTEMNGVYSIYFKNVFSYLKLNLKATADINIYKLELITRSDNSSRTKLWGDCSVDDITVTPSKTAPVASITNGGSDRIFLDCTHGPDKQPLTLNEGEVGHFVFVVPYASFTGSTATTRGFTLKVHTVPLKESYDNDTDVFVDQIVSNSSKNGTTASTTLFQRSTMVDFPEKELVSCFKVDWIKSPIRGTKEAGDNGVYIKWSLASSSYNIKATLKAKCVQDNVSGSNAWILFSLNTSANEGLWIGAKESYTPTQWGITGGKTSSVPLNEKSNITITKTKNQKLNFQAKSLDTTKEDVTLIEAGTLKTDVISSIGFFGSASKTYDGGYYLYDAKIYDITDADDIKCIGDLVPVRRETKTGADTTIDYGLYDNVQHIFFGASRGEILGPNSVVTE